DERKRILRIRKGPLEGDLSPEKLVEELERGMTECFVFDKVVKRWLVRKLVLGYPENGVRHRPAEVDVGHLCDWLLDIRKSRWIRSSFACTG
ncbi:hypothetical protein AAMO2058_001717000, partial [Amorphochlora amoebiformis]